MNKHKGDMEELRRQDEGPMLYKPVRNPGVVEMMSLTDEEFIFVYGVLMWSYSDQLPCRCAYANCNFTIRGSMDLRKYGGRYLCPEHFVEEVKLI